MGLRGLGADDLVADEARFQKAVVITTITPWMARSTATMCLVSTMGEVEDPSRKGLSRTKQEDIAAVNAWVNARDPYTKRPVLKHVNLLHTDANSIREDDEITVKLVDYIKLFLLGNDVFEAQQLFATTSSSDASGRADALRIGENSRAIRFAWWRPPQADSARRLELQYTAATRALLEESMREAVLPVNQSPTSLRFVRSLMGQKQFATEMQGIAAQSKQTAREVIPWEDFLSFRTLVQNREQLRSMGRHPMLRGHISPLLVSYPEFEWAFNRERADLARECFVSPNLVMPSPWTDVHQSGSHRLVVDVFFDPSGGGSKSNAVISSFVFANLHHPVLKNMPTERITLETIDKLFMRQSGVNASNLWLSPTVWMGSDIVEPHLATDSVMVAQLILQHIAKFLQVYHELCFGDGGDVIFVLWFEMNMMHMRNSIPDNISAILAEDNSSFQQDFSERIRQAKSKYNFRDDKFMRSSLRSRIVFGHAPQDAIIDSIEQFLSANGGGGGGGTTLRNVVWQRGHDVPTALDIFKRFLLPQEISKNGESVGVCDVHTVGFTTDDNLKNLGFTRLQYAIRHRYFIMHPDFFSTSCQDVNKEIICDILDEFNHTKCDYTARIKHQIENGLNPNLHALGSDIYSGGGGGGGASRHYKLGLPLKPAFIYGKKVPGSASCKDDLITTAATAQAVNYMMCKFYALLHFVRERGNYSIKK